MPASYALSSLPALHDAPWPAYQEFATGDLGEYDIVCLFIDGVAERLRPAQKPRPVLAAWGFTASGAMGCGTACKVDPC